MSKHKSAGQKLHVRQPLSANSRKIMADRVQNQISTNTPKKTNVNNQYR